MNFSKIFIQEVWKSNVDEISELIELDQDEYVLIKVDKEIDKKDLTYIESEPIVTKDFLNNVTIRVMVVLFCVLVITFIHFLSIIFKNKKHCRTCGCNR